MQQIATLQGNPEASDGEMIVCPNFETLISAIINSPVITDASFTFGKQFLPEGDFPASLDVRQLNAETSGLPEHMTVSAGFHIYCDPATGGCWIEVNLFSKKIYSIDDFLEAAGTFLSHNLGAWYTGLVLDEENTVVRDYAASVRQIISGVDSSLKEGDENEPVE